jgi:hypothetical protein
MSTKTHKYALLVAGSWFCSIAACNTDGVFMRDRPPKGAIAGAPGEARGLDTSSKAGLSVVERREVDLVESVLTHRAEYHRGLEELRDYYRAHGYANKQSWAEFELEGARKVKAFRYVIDSEIPSDKLRPTDQITEADVLYQKGLDLMRKGGRGLPGLYSEKTMIQASDVFRRLVELYPSSDKIDDAAFFLGEIHKEYLPQQEPIAVKWYERAWVWDPATPHPARFQAAVVYDFRLHDRDRALELYRAVLHDETFNGSNVRFSTRRIDELVRDRGQVTAQVTQKPSENP